MLCDFHCLKHVKAAAQSFVILLDLAIYWNKMITCLFVFKMWCVCVCQCKVTAPLFFSIHSLFFTATQNSVIDREGWWWWSCVSLQHTVSASVHRTTGLSPWWPWPREYRGRREEEGEMKHGNICFHISEQGSVLNQRTKRRLLEDKGDCTSE